MSESTIMAIVSTLAFISSDHESCALSCSRANDPNGEYYHLGYADAMLSVSECLYDLFSAA